MQADSGIPCRGGQVFRPCSNVRLGTVVLAYREYRIQVPYGYATSPRSFEAVGRMVAGCPPFLEHLQTFAKYAVVFTVYIQSPILVDQIRGPPQSFCSKPVHGRSRLSSARGQPSWCMQTSRNHRRRVKKGGSQVIVLITLPKPPLCDKIREVCGRCLSNGKSPGLCPRNPCA
jgi:hypothetical protein